MNESTIERNIPDDESLNTVHNLRVVKTEDVDKLMLMDKSDLIKYYEGLIDKCHDVIN